MYPGVHDPAGGEGGHLRLGKNLSAVSLTMLGQVGDVGPGENFAGELDGLAKAEAAALRGPFGAPFRPPGGLAAVSAGSYRR